jgi:sulfite oxidase
MASALVLGAMAMNAHEEEPMSSSCESALHRHHQQDEEAIEESLPVFSAAQVAKNNGSNGAPVWVTYGGIVYDITKFVINHPGGSEKILEAAGKAVEPHWFQYRQHFASDLPMKFLDRMAVGRLDDADQEAVDQQMGQLEEADPYAREPKRHKDLIVHSETPMNAEVPEKLLTRSFLTPNHLFYIRHHHPVPYLTPSEVDDYKVTIDLTSFNGKKIDVSLKDIKNLPKIEQVVTLQCSGNRRRGFNDKERTSGTPWGTLWRYQKKK